MKFSCMITRIFACSLLVVFMNKGGQCYAMVGGSPADDSGLVALILLVMFSAILGSMYKLLRGSAKSAS